MPYKDIEEHRRYSREYCRKHKKARQIADQKRYHQRIGTWTARRLGLTKADYDRLSRGQKHRCAICQKRERIKHERTGKRSRLAVDHNHKTKVIRGLLCRRCNTGLSLFGDSAAVLRRAAKYLERPRKRSQNGGTNPATEAAPNGQ